MDDDVTGEPLPSALLPYCGRPLRETLLRDLEGREYVHYKVFGEQHATPVAIMTSDAKGNHTRVEALCEANASFNRGAPSFRLFRQPMVPMVREGDGRWLVPEAFSPLMKPGGHGVVWKLMLDNGIFDWLRASGRKAALLRQISNPLAGTDGTLLALAGSGLQGGDAFGFASRARRVGASEGCNVLLENPLPEGGYSYSVSNVEYTEFEKLGIEDQEESSLPGAASGKSCYPANTNILYLGLDALEAKVREGAAMGVGGGELILPGTDRQLRPTGAGAALPEGTRIHASRRRTASPPSTGSETRPPRSRPPRATGTCCAPS